MSDFFDADDIEMIIAPSEDETEVVLTYRSKSGKRILMEEFYLDIEAHAKDVLRSQDLLTSPGTIVH